jgi:hypothetical protein
MPKNAKMTDIQNGKKRIEKARIKKAKILVDTELAECIKTIAPSYTLYLKIQIARY